MKYTDSMKADGEMAVRGLSERAQSYYYGTDPLYVYEYQTDEGTRYTVKDSDGLKEDMTIEDLESFLEDLYRVSTVVTIDYNIARWINGQGFSYSPSNVADCEVTVEEFENEGGIKHYMEEAGVSDFLDMYDECYTEGASHYFEDGDDFQLQVRAYTRDELIDETMTRWVSAIIEERHSN